MLPLSLRLYDFNARISAETNLDNLFIPVTRCIFSQSMPDARAHVVTLALFTCLFADWLNVPLFRYVRYAAHGVSLRGVRRVHAALCCMGRASGARGCRACRPDNENVAMARGYGRRSGHSSARLRNSTFHVVVRTNAPFRHRSRKSLFFAVAFRRNGVAFCAWGQVGRRRDLRDLRFNDSRGRECTLRAYVLVRALHGASRVPPACVQIRTRTCAILNGSVHNRANTRARPGWGDMRRKAEAQRLQAIAQHDFAACARVNIVCTHFEH